MLGPQIYSLLQKKKKLLMGPSHVYITLMCHLWNIYVCIHFDIEHIFEDVMKVRHMHIDTYFSCKTLFQKRADEIFLFSIHRYSEVLCLILIVLIVTQMYWMLPEKVVLFMWKKIHSKVIFLIIFFAAKFTIALLQARRIHRFLLDTIPIFNRKRYNIH